MRARDIAQLDGRTQSRQARKLLDIAFVGGLSFKLDDRLASAEVELRQGT